MSARPPAALVLEMTLTPGEWECGREAQAAKGTVGYRRRSWAFPDQLPLGLLRGPGLLSTSSWACRGHSRLQRSPWQRNVGAGSERLDECVPAGKGERIWGWHHYGLNCVLLSNPCVDVLNPVPQQVTAFEDSLGEMSCVGWAGPTPRRQCPCRSG